MENLNDRIKNLFLGMINRPEKIVGVSHNEIKFNNGISIKYWNKGKNDKDVNNEPLKLKSVSWSIDLWTLSVKVVDHLVFTIKTPYREYVVPDFTDRMEYAQVLNTLDEDLAKFENRKLAEYESEFHYNTEPIDDNIPF